MVSITDPLGKQTRFGYAPNDKLTSLTDPKANVTGWSYDVEARVTQKTYPDASTVTYTYESTTSRLKSVLDSLGQTQKYGYAQDDQLTGISYLNAVNATPNVGFTYDPFFPRLASMTDGNGMTAYSYVPIGSLGALQLQQESGPLANSAIAYAYDELGRFASRTVAGAGSETFGYDAIGRATSHTSDLGAFTLSYLGQTSQISQQQLLGSTLSTAWSYLPNVGDRRLAGINIVGLTAGQFSTYGYTTTAENFISATTETSDSASVYPGALTQTASYNNLNQLTNLSGQSLTFDANGNLLSDGQRNYSWDAENRLVGITYPSQPGKQTAFAYDGVSRRTAITSTPAGGSTTATSYLWCGSRICQARNAGSVPIRSYYAEGEFVPGSPAQPNYYGADQIGSTRRVFASTSNAPAYGYDPYGHSLQATASLTDFNYAGMFFNADSGLYLTQYRVYDPVAGRWLSRDPLDSQPLQTGTDLSTGGGNRNLQEPLKVGSFGVKTDLFGINTIPEVGGLTWPNEANLYPYADGNPISFTDPTGQATSKEKIAAFIRFCLALLKFNHPDVEVPPSVNQPLPRISEPSAPPRLPKPPSGGKGPPPGPPTPPTPPISQ